MHLQHQEQLRPHWQEEDEERLDHCLQRRQQHQQHQHLQQCAAASDCAWELELGAWRGSGPAFSQKMNLTISNICPAFAFILRIDQLFISKNLALPGW